MITQSIALALTSFGVNVTKWALIIIAIFATTINCLIMNGRFLDGNRDQIRHQ